MGPILVISGKLAVSCTSALRAVDPQVPKAFGAHIRIAAALRTSELFNPFHKHVEFQQNPPHTRRKMLWEDSMGINLFLNVNRLYKDVKYIRHFPSNIQLLSSNCFQRTQAEPRMLEEGRFHVSEKQPSTARASHGEVPAPTSILQGTVG